MPLSVRPRRVLKSTMTERDLTCRQRGREGFSASVLPRGVSSWDDET